MQVKRLISLLQECDPNASVVGVVDEFDNTQAFHVRDILFAIEVNPTNHNGKVMVLGLADDSDYSLSELDL